jgi:galactose mutarotase-like enzyme
MLYTIQNEFLKITVNETGAELTSIESVRTGQQFMWSGNPDIWPNHAPVLFPIVGGLKDNTYYYQGKPYALPRHGFIRNNKKIKMTGQTEDSLTLSLKFDEESLMVYPFQFEFAITFTLFANRVVVSHFVRNHGKEDMLFSVGAHPAFRCPLHEGETYEDYYLEFEQVETDATWLLTGDGLVSDQIRPVLHNTNILHLNRGMFDQDALIFKNLKSRQVSLRSTKSAQVVTLSYENFPYLGLWAKPNAPFICIEPWLGIADSADTTQNLTVKEGIQTLKANHHFSAAYTIEISA